jgi:hypothetical protein
MDPQALTAALQAASTVAQTGINVVGARRTATQTAADTARIAAIQQRQAAYAAQTAATQAKAKQTQYLVYGFVAISALIVVAGFMKGRKEQ